MRAVAFLAGSPDDLDEAVRRFGATAPRALRGPGGGTAVINYPGRHQRFNASQHFRPLGPARPGLHHMSFEVQDIEQQMVAHRHLRKQGHQPVWGVGRHPLGSHVFDLWKDPNGLRFETYSDTDLCNDQRPTGDHDVAHSEMDLWSNESAEPYFA